MFASLRRCRIAVGEIGKREKKGGYEGDEERRRHLMRSRENRRRLRGSGAGR